MFGWWEQPITWHGLIVLYLISWVIGIGLRLAFAIGKAGR